MQITIGQKYFIHRKGEILLCTATQYPGLKEGDHYFKQDVAGRALGSYPNGSDICNTLVEARKLAKAYLKEAIKGYKDLVAEMEERLAELG